MYCAAETGSSQGSFRLPGQFENVWTKGAQKSPFCSILHANVSLLQRL
jgi:hypothetical protein